MNKPTYREMLGIYVRLTIGYSAVWMILIILFQRMTQYNISPFWGIVFGALTSLDCFHRPVAFEQTQALHRKFWKRDN